MIGMEGERRAREAEKTARESSRHEADRASAPTGRASAPKRGRQEESVDLTSDGDEGPAESSPPPRNEAPPARPRITSRAPATQPPPPAPAPKPRPGAWKDSQLGAPRAASGRFSCGVFGCPHDFVDNAALMKHRREHQHWPKEGLTSEPSEVEPTPAPADPSRAARDRSASVPSSTPKTARTRDAVDLDEEPDDLVVTMQMKQVQLGTFDCGACEVAFSEKAIRFYTDEATRFQPHGYHEEIELEISALTRIEIDKEKSTLCVSGFFGYHVEGYYSPFATGPESRVLLHLATGEGAGVWKGSDRAEQVGKLMRLSPDIKQRTGFNPTERDFANELRLFKRRQTGEEHAPKPPKAAAGRGSRGSQLQASATTGSGSGGTSRGSGSTSAGRFPGAGQRMDGKGASGTPQIGQYYSATPRERSNHRPQRNPGRSGGSSFDRDFGGSKKKAYNEKAPTYPRPHPQPHLQPSPDPNPTPPYTKVLIYPEESAKDAVTLTEEECDRLDEKEFLNDSLVDYELKRIQAAALQPEGLEPATLGARACNPRS